MVAVNPRKNKGISELKKAIELVSGKLYKPAARNFIDIAALAPGAIKQAQLAVPHIGDYEAIHYLINHETFALPDDVQEQIEQAETDNQFNPARTQAEEILQRYTRINHILSQAVVFPDPQKDQG